MKTFLITGGAGNLGSTLANRLLLDDNNRVIVVDNLSTGRISNLPNDSDSFSFFNADVNSYEELHGIMERFQVDYVFHYAAIVGVQRTLENPLAVLQDIEGIKNILDLSRDLKVKRVFYSSSSEVYGESTVLPQKEDLTPLNCRLPYAAVKNIGEAFFRSYYQEYGLEYTIFRFFNTYGPEQSQDFVIPRFIDAAIRNDDITIYGDGSQTRTFCHVNDNVETIVKIIEESLCKNDVINIGSSKEFTIKNLAEIIIAVTKSSSSIVHLPALKEGDMCRRQPDNAKMRRILGRPLISLETGIADLLSARHRS
ncbi:NAD-dependent epimerase/dehydratase family protein [Sphingobacterium paludis]|uniref:UDP-glucose 4-epimerase n=1 Tax=Sphingobacterium paludis TaxID=1476465 RepID=A0A4R7CZ41_9SPHI|nr:NAD-dependent epimerase/dehydratase family protein [Sphingobacterium paludis]TDS13869.1 UDP-glucose 4-epimerase [Sphingobacterium paludis]